MPNFIKSRAKIINNRRSNGQKKNEKNKLTNDKNEPTTSTVNQKVQESDNCDKQSKKNIEVCTNFVQDKLRTYFNQSISNINK